MVKFSIPQSLILLTIFITTICYASSPINTNAENKKINDVSVDRTANTKTVIVNLRKNTVSLRENNKVVNTFRIVTQGRPGSYYETIGGNYVSDFKVELHFSSLGHVYMPYSVHVFGNYFIHGIPYYPDGVRVSSTYSGGCVRLEDGDAKTVFDFVTPETTIIITKYDEHEFEPTPASDETILSENMTRLMVAVISLEFLAQDETIIDKRNNVTTTRKDLLPRLFDNDGDVGELYALSFKDDTYVSTMNRKARSLGLSRTTFTSISSPVITTDVDYARFMGYISLYKSYLLTDVISTSTY